MIETSKTVETVERVHVTFTCDVPGCSFSVANNREAAEEHHARNHACAEERVIDDIQLRRFVTMEDAEAYARCQRFYDEFEVTWEGPGWYVQGVSSQPCGKGCCYRDRLDLAPVSHEIASLRESARLKLRQARSLRDLERKLKAFQNEPEADQ